MIRKVLAFLLAFALLGARAAADPVSVCTDGKPCHLRTHESTTLHKEDGHEFLLPPGHFYDELTWQSLDLEVRRLQDSETRLKAQNQSLRGSLAGWQPGWLSLSATLVAGMLAGGGLYYWHTR